MTKIHDKHTKEGAPSQSVQRAELKSLHTKVE